MQPISIFQNLKQFFILEIENQAEKEFPIRTTCLFKEWQETYFVSETKLLIASA